MANVCEHGMRYIILKITSMNLTLSSNSQRDIQLGDQISTLRLAAMLNAKQNKCGSDIAMDPYIKALIGMIFKIYASSYLYFIQGLVR